MTTFYCSSKDCGKPIIEPRWHSIPLDRTIELAWCEECIHLVTTDKDVPIELNKPLDYRIVKGVLCTSLRG